MKKYFFRASVVSAVNGGPMETNLLPIYAFKAGDAQSGSFFRGELTMQDAKGIFAAADGARMLTVSTHHIWARRYLANRDIPLFHFFLMDSTRPDHYTYPVAAMVMCRDMKGGNFVPAGGNAVSMSTESVRREFTMVTLSFFDSDGGPSFEQTLF